MSVYQRSSSLVVQPVLEFIHINCIDDIVATALDLLTLQTVSSTCGKVFLQIVWIFPLLWHSNEQSNRLILHLFFISFVSLD